jgi:hypothetical protein
MLRALFRCAGAAKAAASIVPTTSSQGQVSDVRQAGNVRVARSARSQAPSAAASAASTLVSDWPGTVTSGRSASNGATNTSAQRLTHATVATFAWRSAFERASPAREDKPGAATRDIGLTVTVSKNLATGARWQGTAGAYRRRAQKRSDPGATPTIARNSTSRPAVGAEHVAEARAVRAGAVYGTGKPFRHAKRIAG